MRRFNLNQFIVKPLTAPLGGANEINDEVSPEPHLREYHDAVNTVGPKKARVLLKEALIYRFGIAVIAEQGLPIGSDAAQVMA